MAYPTGEYQQDPTTKGAKTMKTAQSYLSQEINHLFTDEAWSQFEAYLNSLLLQLTQYNINEQQILHTFRGIEEYVVGYADELVADSRITFRQTIDLIEDIGTPSEILSELETITDVQQSTEEQQFCIECGSQISKSLIYCNHCGRNTTLPNRQFSPFKQAIIDNPLGYAFGFVFGGAFLLSLLGFLIGLIAVASGVSITVSLDFGFIVLIVIVLSIIASIIGWLIDEIYGEYNSFKQRYERIQGYFESNRFIGHFLVVIGTMTYLLGGIIYRDNALGNPDGNMSAFFVTLLMPMYLLIVMSTSDFPEGQELPYYQLLNLKSHISKKVFLLLFEFNKKSVMPMIIVSGLWHYLVFQNFLSVTAYAAIPGWFMFLLLFVVTNGLYYAHLHTWRFLRSLTK